MYWGQGKFWNHRDSYVNVFRTLRLLLQKSVRCFPIQNSEPNRIFMPANVCPFFLGRAVCVCKSVVVYGAAVALAGMWVGDSAPITDVFQAKT